MPALGCSTAADGTLTPFSPALQAMLHVDGQNVGYAKPFNSFVITQTFTGFLMAGGATGVGPGRADARCWLPSCACWSHEQHNRAHSGPPCLADTSGAAFQEFVFSKPQVRVPSTAHTSPDSAANTMQEHPDSGLLMQPAPVSSNLSCCSLCTHNLENRISCASGPDVPRAPFLWVLRL